MRAIGLDGKEYKWNITNYVPDKHSERPRSQYHIKARTLLREIFPRDRLLEEVSLPGSKTTFRKSVLYADFYIPNRNLIIEVHGEQHYAFNSFYHKNKIDFFKSQQRDRDKAEWCQLNDLRLVALKYSDSAETWRKLINEQPTPDN